jgi:hypothetical protein
LLRDVDSSYYLRQEKMGFNLGPYENPCRRIGRRPDDPMPEDFSFQLFPTIWSGWNGTSTTRWRACRFWARRT